MAIIGWEACKAASKNAKAVYAQKTKTWYISLVALLAQLAEQLTLNQRVAGSSPAQGIFIAVGCYKGEPNKNLSNG